MTNAPPTPAAPARLKDVRVQRTKKLLTQALVELAAEGPTEALTVRDLTARAQVGYATFFRHYASIEDLLREAVDNLYIELMALLPPLTGGHPEKAGAVVFRHVRTHSGLYRLLLQPDRSLGLTDRLMETGVRGLLTAYEPQRDARVPPEVAAYHFIRSFLSLIEWWLDHAQPLTPERMGEIYRDLILAPTEAVALQPRLSVQP